MKDTLPKIALTLCERVADKMEIYTPEQRAKLTQEMQKMFRGQASSTKAAQRLRNMMTEVLASLDQQVIEELAQSNWQHDILTLSDTAYSSTRRHPSIAQQMNNLLGRAVPGTFSWQLKNFFGFGVLRGGMDPALQSGTADSQGTYIDVESEGEEEGGYQELPSEGADSLHLDDLFAPVSTPADSVPLATGGAPPSPTPYSRVFAAQSWESTRGSRPTGASDATQVAPLAPTSRLTECMTWIRSLCGQGHRSSEMHPLLPTSSRGSPSPRARCPTCTMQGLWGRARERFTGGDPSIGNVLRAFGLMLLFFLLWFIPSWAVARYAGCDPIQDYQTSGSGAAAMSCEDLVKRLGVWRLETQQYHSDGTSMQNGGFIFLFVFCLIMVLLDGICAAAFLYRSGALIRQQCNSETFNCCGCCPEEGAFPSGSTPEVKQNWRLRKLFRKGNQT